MLAAGSHDGLPIHVATPGTIIVGESSSARRSIWSVSQECLLFRGRFPVGCMLKLDMLASTTSPTKRQELVSCHDSCGEFRLEPFTAPTFDKSLPVIRHKDVATVTDVGGQYHRVAELPPLPG